MANNITFKVFSVFLAVLPALAVYGILPGTSLGMLFMALVTISILFNHGFADFGKDEMRLLAALLCVTLISLTYHTVIDNSYWLDVNLFVHNLYSIALCFLPLIIAVKHANIRVFVRVLYAIGILASIVVIWQRVSLITTGNFFGEVFLPWFEVRRDIETMSFNRPSAFFTEPAHLCIFLLPIFYITLLSRKYIFSGLFLFAILCSGSTTGFILTAVVVLYDIYYKGGRHRFDRMILSLVLFVVVYYLIITFYPQIIYENVEKLSDTREGYSDIRLLGPLSYLSLFDTFESFFGITLNQLEGFLRNHAVSFSGHNANYANAMLYMMISYGAIGSIAFLVYLYKKWKSASLTKGFFIVFLGILCSDQILFNAHFLYLSAFVILSDSIANVFQPKSIKK